MQPLHDTTFQALSTLMHGAIGVHFPPAKKPLVASRLAPRIQKLGLGGYDDYLQLITGAGSDGATGGEFQMAIDLLTTNETHFFREPRHFTLLREEIARLLQAGLRGPLRLWSAACSTGEEPYSLAMTLAETMGDKPWRVHASDLSAKVLDDARQGIYGAQRASEVPPELSRRYLLEGFDEYAGQYRIDASLRQRVTFQQINLMTPLPALEPFDAVFLRNVLIYFDTAAKKRIVESVVQQLRPGGLLFIGHSETLNGVTEVARPVVPTVYRRPA